MLAAMLEPLCGWGCAKEGDAGVRESLAEALMMLVGCMGPCWLVAATARSNIISYAVLLD